MQTTRNPLTGNCTRVGEVYINFRDGTIEGDFSVRYDAHLNLIEAFKRIIVELETLPIDAAYLDYDEGKVHIG